MKSTHFLKETFASSLAALLGLFLLPLLLLPGDAEAAAQPADAPLPAAAAPASAEEPSSPPTPAVRTDEQRTLRVLHRGTVTEMTLHDYLVGVVAAEMPAAFEPEALKAQAVAARTYTLYKLRSGGSHDGTADICTDSTCCQAYIDLSSARENWGANADAYTEKVCAAVSGTDGEAITYGGVPILAVFHSSSAGVTRAAGEVWQSDLPYLRPVSSPEPADSIPNYYSRVELSTAAFREKVLARIPGADLSGGVETWLHDAVRDSAGSVEEVTVGGVRVRGSTLRSALGLRSACFEWEIRDGTFLFYVTGYGHGVGLSQYGANAMAADGADYRTILTHYYTGVSIEVCSPDA